MKLPKLSIKNYQFTIMIFLILIALGISSYITMPRSEDPFYEGNFASAVIIAPGTSTIDLESGIADILEERIIGIEDIKHIDTTIEDGLVIHWLEFDPGTDMEKVETRLNNEVISASDKFPPGVIDTYIYRGNILYVKIMLIAVTGKYEMRDLFKFADIIKSELQKIDGTADVEIIGYPGEEISIELISERLAQYHIPSTVIYQILQTNNYNIPAGEVKVKNRKFSLRTSGKYESLKQIGKTVIGAYDSKSVYLKDVAAIDYKYSNPRYKTRFQGNPALLITFKQKKDKNLLTINDNLKSKLREIRDKLPADLKTKIVFDQSASVRTRVNTFFRNLLQGVILVGIVVFIIVGGRPSIVIMLAIPFSLIMAIGFIDTIGYGLQQMTIVALIISLGLLVDNAIVITENIQRFLDKGHKRLSAAEKGASEVGWPVVSAAATTILAFVPMMLMKDMTGDYIRSMPVGVAITLACSLLIALTLSPMLSYYILKPIPKGEESRSRRIFNSIVQKWYKPLLKWSLEHKKTVILIALSVFLVSLVMFKFIDLSYFPMAEKPQLLINVNLPRGVSLDKTDSVMQEIEVYLNEQNEIVDHIVNIGRGNPPVYYNMGYPPEKKNFGQIFLQLKPDLTLQKVNAFTLKLREKYRNFAGANITVEQFRQGPRFGDPIEVRIIGDNGTILKELSAKVKIILEDIPGCINIKNPLEFDAIDLKLKIERDKAAMLGISLIDIDRVVRMAVSGIPVGEYRDDAGDAYSIILRLPENEKDRFSDFDRIYLPSRSGKQIPLSQVARVTFTPGYNVVQHYDLDRAVTVTSDATGREVSEINRDIEEKIKTLKLPTGYRISLAGEEEHRGESFSSLAKAALIALLGIYAILVFQFRSFVQPVIIYISLPFAVTGSIWGLLLSGQPFSFSAFIGLASLIGIVVNNAIILVDYANRLRKEGKGPKDALITACLVRFRPIISTTLTTIGGILPLTLLGSTLWTPFGWVLIGGLLVSTLLTLIMVPIFYYILTGKIHHDPVP